MNDYCCFKYRTINKYLLDSLVKSQLFFAPRGQLNDPFDSNIDILRAVDQLIKIDVNSELFEKFRSDEDVLNRFNKNVDPLGICSFSLISNETLMWSHYADDHKGICLRYDFPESFLNNEDEILGVSRVSYEPNAISSWLSDNIELFEADHKKFIINLLMTLLTSKAPSWSYEKEARIIRPSTGLYKIPRATLTHIIFGLQTTEADETLIRSIADKYYGSVKFGKVIRTDDDFGIDAEEI